jgi:AcrR family transcriptional regulator
MDKKQIQSERMRGYFIQAAKELLKGEGLKTVNTRSVADRAGYSYTTMYNYFKDLNDLIFECVKDFQAECELFVRNKTKKVPSGKEKIKAITTAYVHYFTEYPGIFELCFIERMRDIGHKKGTAELIHTFLDRLCEEQWSYCISEKLIDAEKAENMKAQLRYSVTGMLLFYENRLQPDNYKDFTALVSSQLDFILG